MTDQEYTEFTDGVWEDGVWISWDWIRRQVYEQELQAQYDTRKKQPRKSPAFK
jgi:hypothetical protein